MMSLCLKFSRQIAQVGSSLELIEAESASCLKEDNIDSYQ